VDVTASPAALQRNIGSIDITATSRLFGWVWLALRLVYAAAFTAFIVLYAMGTFREPGGQAGPLLGFALPATLLVALWTWSAVGRPLRSIGAPALLLLAFAAASSLYGMAVLAADPSRMAVLWRPLTSAIPALPGGGSGLQALTLIALSLGGMTAALLCVGLNAALRLRFGTVPGTGWTLTVMDRRVRRVVMQSGDARSMARQLRTSRRLGWLASAGAVAALFGPLLLPGMLIPLPGADWLAGHLPERLAAMLTAIVRTLALPSLLLALLLGWIAARCRAPKGRFFLAASGRPPLLLLRSRADDPPAIVPATLWRRDVHALLWPLRIALWLAGARDWHRVVLSAGRWRLEEIAARGLRDVGPFVALGDPREPQPDLSPFYTPTDEENWQGYVRVWICDARLVVLPAGLGEITRSQLAAAAELDVLHKLILLMPPGSAPARRAYWRHAVDSLSKAAPGEPPADSAEAAGALAVCFDGSGPSLVITGARRGERDYDLALRIAQGLLLAEAPEMISRVPA
jgi:hypothetical protein